jgi:hypothetical protein
MLDEKPIFPPKLIFRCTLSVHQAHSLQFVGYPTSPIITLTLPSCRTIQPIRIFVFAMTDLQYRIQTEPSYRNKVTANPEPLMSEFVPDYTGSIPNDRVVDHFFGSHKTHAVFYL